MEDVKKIQILRKRLDTLLVKLVKPEDMSVDEYHIACNLEGFNATVNYGPFLHWILTAGGDDSKVVEKVDKIDNGNAPSLPFICEAEDEYEALEKYNAECCLYDYLIAIECDWEEVKE